ncbi:MAG: sodium:solute symporter family protein [Hydrogenobaculum sp.]|nr:MAG: sodium:solute symporter [Hydrogenobaculum sp.]PMP91866.1 MAG: sodium:solute symporter [Hydrogenobaculum sp.]
MVSVVVFLLLFIVFSYLGLKGKDFKAGNLDLLHEWALGGQRFGALLLWFLIGADLFTAYTFIAVPSGLFAKGPIFFFAVPYVAMGFGVALAVMPKFFAISKEKCHITAVDFVKDRYNSKALAITIAIVGILAELPYIALQIVGMKVVLATLLMQFKGINQNFINELSLSIAFLILSWFTYKSGLRGATLTAVLKDFLILGTVVVLSLYIPLHYHGFYKAFEIKKAYATLNPKLISAYISLSVMSALALFLYPHAITGCLSSSDVKVLKRSIAFLPVYGIGLAILALFGVLIYEVKPAMDMLNHIPASARGSFVVPALIVSTMPQWFSGIALLGIFIGGLVPASIMAIASSNLMVNILRELNIANSSNETKIAKWFSFLFKLIPLFFVFVVPPTFAIALQLVGGIIVLQTLPSIFLGLFIKNLNKESLMMGLLAGIGFGVYELESVNHFGLIQNILMPSPFGPIFIGAAALGVNIAIVALGSFYQYIFRNNAQ